MNSRVKVLEKRIRRGDLALRFTDNVLRTPVGAGLAVEAWMKETVAPRFPAVQAELSGIYGFHTLPGLRGYEIGERPFSDFCQGPDNENFVIAIADRLERFLPLLLLECLPKDQVIDLPLFSSPARPTPSGFGAIRGELWDRVAGVPASWAKITATIGSSFGLAAPLVTETLADERGMFVLFVPYAASLPSLTGDPPISTAPIGELQWELTLKVFYRPATVLRVAGSDVLELRSIQQQPQGTIYKVFDEDNEVSEPTLVTSIRFGVELVVKSAIVETQDEEAQKRHEQYRGRLLVKPAP